MDSYKVWITKTDGLSDLIMTIQQEEINQLNSEFRNATLIEVLAYVLDRFQDNVILASSLGLEDQILTHFVQRHSKKARIMVLDTLRLNQETYDLLKQMQEEYQVTYEIYYPNNDAVEALVSTKGTHSFYESIENRKECCHIRKIEPLTRVLKTVDAWITGLRKDQSVTRQDMALFEYDQTHKILKVNPLIHWDYETVRNVIKAEKIPYNALHDQGYPSIGCEPCTRAVKEGEDIRAGRWWWEAADQKECGLHSKKDNQS